MMEDKPDETEEPGIGLRSTGKPNIWLAMGAYAVLAILAGLTLNGSTIFEFRLRVLVWLLLGALAIRTWVHTFRERL
jgi:hypothetical protein